MINFKYLFAPLLFGLNLVSPRVLRAGWMVDSVTVDDTVTAGLYNAIALDGDGVPAITYYDADNLDLKLATRNEDGNWIRGTVVSERDVGQQCSLAIDGSGTPHVSYQDRYQQSIPYPPYSFTRGELKYVAGTNGTPVTLDNTTGQIGQSTAIALDADGNPRVAYQAVTLSGNSLKYIAKAGGVWGSPQTVESGGAAVSMALDSSGYPHIVHVDGTNLRYVFWNGSSWTAETVEDYGVQDERTAIALDSAGHPHIVFVTTDGLIYAFHDGENWTFETVHNVAGMGAVGAASPALALNSDDEPFISYHGTLWGETAVVVAVRTDVDEWQFPAWLLEETAPGGQTSITIDSNNVLHVSFHDATAGALGYASVMADTDNDWLPDWWEMQYFHNLGQGSSDDPDGDSITNNDEYWGGTDPTVRDSVDNSWDRDGDGLGNDDETNIYGTDPDDPDSDDDGLLDGVETGYHLFWDSFEDGEFRSVWAHGGDALWAIDTNIGTNGNQSARSGLIGDGQTTYLEMQAVLLGKGRLSFYYRTSCQSDADVLSFSTNGATCASYSGENDWAFVGFTDIAAGTHVFRWTYEKDMSGSAGSDAVWIDAVYIGVDAIGSDPNDADSDDDNLTDGDEVITYGTNPNAADSDSDGLDDDDEINTHSTDPLDPDSDDDGLTDGEEVNTTHTGPNDADSDDDGMPDGWEVDNTLNPLANDAAGDADSDALSNLQEYQAGTDPQDADSDDDGMPDGWEVDNTLNPLVDDAAEDTKVDSDGLTNYQEYLAGTDPHDSDSDDDGMPDGWEVTHALNPLTDDAAGDPDSDGLTNLQEYTRGTDPRDSDSDNDLMPDGWEVANGFNPLSSGDSVGDADGDGLTNRQEYQNGTDPNDSDSDDDTMPDGWEVGHSLNPLADDTAGDPDSDGLGNLGEYQAGSNPQDNDSDDDTMPDGWEVAHALNPLADDAAADADTDGLTNLQEYGQGTAPNDADSDDDTMPDGWEVGHSLNPLADDAAGDADSDGLTNLQEFTRGTDPRDSDSDDDTLSDGEEVNSRGTDPTDSDSDDDGMPDGWEVSHAFNPLADDAADDADSDGLTNLQEYELGTAPNDSDSDDDTMPDGWEVGNALNPLVDDAAGDADSDALTNLQEYQNNTDPNDNDSDDDGMPDGWEFSNGLEPDDPAGVNGASGDPDGDGLDNGDEYTNNADPQDSDTDNDGMPDGWEVANSLEPDDASGLNGASGDPDNDNLDNGDEYTNNADPQDSDTDDDGLSDGAEVHTYGTEPDHADSDGDSLSDGWEVAHGLNPLEADTDGDGLEDGDEVNTYSTDPDDDDSDDDGMPDGWELANGLNPLVDDADDDADGDGLTNLEEYTQGSSAQSVDGDSDGLSDWDEIYIHGTDPLDADSDDDGLVDGHETGWGPLVEEYFTNIVLRAEWITSGNSVWTVVDEENYGWEHKAAKSGATGISRLSRTVDVPQAAWLSFAVRVSSEYGYGTLRFKINGQTVAQWSGEEPWPMADSFSCELQPGEYTLLWEYQVGAIQGGEEAAWLDDVIIQSYIDYNTDPLDPDTDGDGLTDGDEVLVYQTSPTLADTDFDGLSDYAELFVTGTNPRDADSDNDGLSDGAEVNTHDTDPLDADSDDDGLSDGAEVNTHGTDPLDTDSEDDGMPDGWEVVHSLNPLANDAPGDPDEDGLSNLDEYGHETHPQDPDSDNDGMTDGEEVNVYGCDPLRVDTDGDGLGDGEEATGDGNYLESFEDGVLPPGWTTGGDAPWTIEEGEAAHGDSALRSPVIGPSQSSWLEFTFRTGPRDVWWLYNKTVSASPYLTCTIDGQPVWQGETGGWYGGHVSLSTGMHTLRWVYAKGPGAPWGDDVFRLDLFTIPNPPWGTDPMNPDTDGDGLSDGRETLAEVLEESESFESAPPPLSFVALGRAPLEAPVSGGWSSTGDAPWINDTQVAYDGTASKRSGAIADGQQSVLAYAVSTAKGNVSFWYRVSSEAAADALTFSIDGVALTNWSGMIGWSQATFPVSAGQHVFTWTYSKNGSGSAGTDAVWIDLFQRSAEGTGTDPSNPDSDGDGMPDGWEVTMGFEPTFDDGADDADGDLLSNNLEYVNRTNPFNPDTDGDGQNDYEEVVITGMSPTNASSLLKIEHLAITPSGSVLTWLSASNRVYDLLSTTNLAEAFQTVHSNLPAGPDGHTVFTNTTHNTPVFYRIKVRTTP